MKSIPWIPPGRVVVTPVRDTQGELTYSIKGPAPQPIRVNAGMLLIGLFADGHRNLGEIYQAAATFGLAIPDPAMVVLTFRQLEQIGAVRMSWHIESLAPLNQECETCGQSCEGFLIGPLSDPEVERLIELQKELESLEPSLPDTDPCVLVYQGDTPRPVLNMSSGQCVFLTEQRLCAIHKHFGLEKKPLNCKLFPLRVIETEDGFRVGYTSHCARSHRSQHSNRQRTCEETFTELGLRRPPGDIVGLEPTNPRSLRLTPDYEKNLEREQFLLSLVTKPNVTLTEVIASADGSSRAGTSIPAPYLGNAAVRLRRFGETYQPDPFNTEGTVFGGSIRQFLTHLTNIQDPLPEWSEPPPMATNYLLRSFGQAVYLREGIRHGSVEIGAQIVVLGILGALWCSGNWVEGEDVDPTLGEQMAHWLRLTNSDRAFDLLFDDHHDFLTFQELLAG